MSIEAPVSRYKKQNILIMIVVSLGLAGWFYYDGHHNESFIEKHTVTDDDGGERPNSTLVFNRNAPPFLVAAAIAAGVYFVVIRGKKVVADETSLTVGKTTVPFDAIEKIDKTHFDSKGFFMLTYKDAQGQSRDLKLSDRTYDNMGVLLDHVVAKIS